jgi:hypothetical protein
MGVCEFLSGEALEVPRYLTPSDMRAAELV